LRLLVFQHCESETPAAFADHAKASGDSVHVVKLFNGDTIPEFDLYDGLLVMGGPMDIWETDEHPWLIVEKQAIKQWLDCGKPYLGICLGHQLLVEAKGGRCAKMQNPEIAISDVTLTNTAKDDPLCKGLPSVFPAMHWHGVEAVELPDQCEVLGRSDKCSVQVLHVGQSAWGLQFHPELVEGTVTGWMSDKSNLDAAASWLGSQEAAWEFVEQSEREASGFINRSARIYENFRSLVP
jgi:GMP synthase-like glutamine amidotransferase